MTIQRKLQLTGLVPIVLLFLISSYFIVISYINIEKANALKTLLKNNTLMNNTLVNIGKERGLTALHLGSDKYEFSSSLHKQREKVDESLTQLKDKTLTTTPYYIPQLISLLLDSKYTNENSYVLLEKDSHSLPEMRKKIDNSNMNFENIFFDYYTKKLTEPAINNLKHIQNYGLNSEISSLIYKLVEFYNAEEYSSLERDFISYYLMKRSSLTYDKISLWHSFKAKASLYDISIIDDSDLIATYEKLIPKLSLSSSLIQRNIFNGRYKESATHWFALQTNKISLLSKSQMLIATKLWERSECYRQQQLIFLGIAAFIWLLSLILGYLNSKITRDISQKINTLTEKSNQTIYIPIDSQKENEKKDKIVTEEVNDTQPHFLSNTSREIQTQVNSIVASTKDLSNTNLDEKQSKIVSKIDENAKDLLAITNNIFRLSKIKNHKTEIKNTDDTIIDQKSETIDLSSVTTIPNDKKILIAKKYILEEKILVKVIENLGYDYDILKEINTLQDKIETGDYYLVFTDSDSESSNKSAITIVTKQIPKDEIQKLILENKH